MKRRSIGELLKRSGSLAERRQIAETWAASWQAEHDGLIREMERAVGTGRTEIAGRLLGQIKGMHAKRFGALPRVIASLSDEDIE